MQRVPDKGWEGRRAVTKVVGNKEKVNGNTQTEGHKHGNAMDTNNGMGDKVAGLICPAGSRNYKQGNRKNPGPLQTTLNKFWKGKDKKASFPMSDMPDTREMHKLRIWQQNINRLLEGQLDLLQSLQANKYNNSHDTRTTCRFPRMHKS